MRPDDRVTRSLSGFHSENRDKDKKPPTKNDQFIAILSLRVKDLDKLIIPSYPPNIFLKKEDANYFDGKTICAFSAFITTIFF